MVWPALNRTAPRVDGAIEDHFLSALCAASIARRTSFMVPLGTLSTTSPVAGLRTSVVCPLSESTCSPAINIFAIRILLSYVQNLEKNHVHCGKPTIRAAIVARPSYGDSHRKLL